MSVIDEIYNVRKNAQCRFSVVCGLLEVVQRA